MSASSKHRGLFIPVFIIFGAIGLFVYGIIAGLSDDPQWFLGRTTLPDPQRIVILVDGDEAVLTPASAGYPEFVAAARKALSSFSSLGLGSAGLGEATLAEYQREGVLVEMYFSEPVDFHLPFDDGQPTALLVPIRGPLAGRGYVFRGRGGKWWAGQLTVSDPQPMMDVLSAQGYVE